ncbi:MAG: hypothetical protein JO001_20810 [Alphaproteobacteria bacterium]|nr:hypothetical protein [Alphaproteobacteria bacterium]
MNLSAPLASSRPYACSTRARLQIAVGLGVLSIIIGLTAAILSWCGGHLVYSLDDPLIALAMGWHLAQGDFGINAGEAASPASSILFPFVLAGFAWTRWQIWAPLVLNAAAAIVTSAAFAAALCRYGIVQRREQIGRASVLLIVFCVATNLIGVVFCGLEHSLHTLTCVIVVFGLARAFDTGRANAVLVVAIILMPLWRFEGVAFAILAIGALAATRHWRHAAAALLGVVLTLALYMGAMHILGLPLLPSSVLAKSAVANDFVGPSSAFTPLFGLIAHNASENFNREELPLAVLMALALAHTGWRLVSRRRASPGRVAEWSLWQESVFAAAIVGAMLAQLLFGRGGGFLRYGVYSVAIGSAGNLVLWRGAMERFFARSNLIGDLLAAIALISVGLLYVVETAATPLAARGIYEQQYQMRRLAVDYYAGPVAVNDLGWVSYRNPNYVLDLYGLGSEAARQARLLEDQDKTWMGRLVRAQDIGMVMLYADKFSSVIPREWTPVAMLRAPHYIAPEIDTVTIYATSDAATAAVRQAVMRLQAGGSPGHITLAVSRFAGAAAR